MLGEKLQQQHMGDAPVQHDRGFDAAFHYGPDPTDPARPIDGRSYGFVVLSVNVSVLL